MRIAWILFILFAGACSGSKIPDDILPPDKMKKVIFDLMRADEFVNVYVLKDTAKKRNVEAIKMYQQVFTIHNITKEKFFNSFKYYQGHPDQNKVLFDSLTSWANK